ncbi:RpiB/LacA/LacB family sugar-phosphate isomerase [Candidatus Saccharibacteria bacterium]|nr:RpiB/LacA/LacB family sugar-phosphate isomerase [Candidatus Saccharibacteria bacterium]
MKIYLGADHNGFQYKQDIANYLTSTNYEVVDKGSLSIDPNDDFPQFAARTVTELLGNPDPEAKAILICGSGQGMVMAANRFKGIRASLCWNVEEARASRNDDDSNVLCLSSRYLSSEEVQSIIHTFLNTSFAGAPRFIRRIQALDELS